MDSSGTLSAKLLLSPGLRDYFSYNDAGQLQFSGYVLTDLAARYGSPLEITDTRILQQRAREWQTLCGNVAKDLAYDSGFEFFYASKANMSLEFTRAAYASGWQAETSSAQDLVHLMWMDEKGILPKDIKIISNGYKLVPPVAKGAASYAELLVSMHNKGYAISPIIEVGEEAYFAQQRFEKVMSVGIRMKFGQTDTQDSLEQHISRHGYTSEEVIKLADSIASNSSLRLELLHAMVGSAEAISIESFLASLLFATDYFFQLKKKYPTLTYFDIGGGLPSALAGYDYERFLRMLLSGILEQSQKYNLDPPCLVWECGSYLAEEASCVVFSSVQRYKNSTDDIWWYLINGGLMAALPDMLLVQKSFPVLSGNYGHTRLVRARVGDVSCDSDGRYPSRKAVTTYTWLPDEENVAIVFAGTGAYQRMLSGMGGAHHCGIPNMGRLIIEELDGKITETYISPQTPDEYMRLAGYIESRLSAFGSV